MTLSEITNIRPAYFILIKLLIALTISVNFALFVFVAL